MHLDTDIRTAQDYPDMLPSDGDAWTENNNMTYPWHHSPNCPDTIEFTTDDVVEGSYSVKVTHDSATEFMAFYLDLKSGINVEAYDYVSYYYKFRCPTTESMIFEFCKTGAFSGNKRRVGNLLMLNNTWRRVLIPLKAFRWVTNPLGFDEIRYLCWFTSSLSPSSNAEFYVDNLYFGIYETPAVSNSLNELMIPNFYSYYPQFPEKTVARDGHNYTSLMEFQNIITAAEQSSNIESEVLGHTIMALSIAYNVTKDKQVLARANTYANWLLQLQNETVGGFHNDWLGSYLSDTIGGTHNGWCLAGLSYLYGVTQNDTYKTAAHYARRFICDVLWDDENKLWDKSYNTSNGVVDDALDWHPMRCGAISAGLAAYYRFVSANSTAKSQVEQSFSSMRDVAVGASNATYSYGGAFEDTTYQHFGFYEGYMAFQNTTYRTWAEYTWDIAHAQYEILKDGSACKNHLAFQNDGNGLDGWGVACSQLLRMLLYDLNKQTHHLKLYEKTMFDYLESIRTEATGLNSYAISRYRLTDDLWSNNTYVPSQVFLYASLLLYEFKVITDWTPITISSDDLVISMSYSSQKLMFIVAGTNGGTSTTQVYCCDKGNPLALFTINGSQTHDYNATTMILTLNVSHRSPTKMLIYWRFPGDVNNDRIVDATDLTSVCKAYGATPSSLNWDEGCDINGDEIVDETDLSIEKDDYGKSEPL